MKVYRAGDEKPAAKPPPKVPYRAFTDEIYAIWHRRFGCDPDLTGQEWVILHRMWTDYEPAHVLDCWHVFVQHYAAADYKYENAKVFYKMLRGKGKGRSYNNENNKVHRRLVVLQTQRYYNNYERRH